MAEWTGRKQRRQSATDPEASHRNQERNETPQGPEAPGAISSPQLPGEVPDRSTVPGQFATRVPRATSVQRPLTEEGTAQAIMNVYAASLETAMDPARFEQATASYEEMRKANPAQLPPTRPGPGYALRQGDAMASELQEIGGAGPTPAQPVVATGEASNAQPGGKEAPEARKDAPATEVGSAFSPSDAPASVRAPEDAMAGSGAVGGGGQMGESRWAEAAKPGDVSSAAGTLPAAKESEAGDRGGTGSAPLVTPK